MKKKIITASLWMLIFLFYSLGHAGSFALQGNLEALTYYSASVPFKDLMFQSLNAGLKKTIDNTDCAVTPIYDANGYPTNVPNDCYFSIIPVLHINDSLTWNIPPLAGLAPFKKGHYIFKYSGVADFEFQNSGVVNVIKMPDQKQYEFDVTSPGAQGITIKVKNYGTPYPTDFHLVHADDFATYKKQPFNESFLAALAPYEILRFMDWGKTNEAKLVYSNDNLPAANLTPSSLQLGSDASVDPLAYNDKMVAIVKVNGKYTRVMLSGYTPLTKTIQFATPLPISTDGAPVSVVIRDFYNRTWGSRTPLSPILQTSSSGIAFEYMIKLANVTKKDPWFCIPTAADDVFVKKLLRLIDKKLNKKRKAYLEYSNETWAFNFPQYDYSEAMEKKLGLNTVSQTIIPADAFGSYRATQIFKMASRLRKEPELRSNRTSSRFVRVLASQAVWKERSRAVMDWGLTLTTAPTYGHAAHEYADVFAIAPYFGKPNGDATDLATATQDQLYDIQKRSIDSAYGTSLSPGFIREQLLNTNQRGIKLAQYEGGASLVDRNQSPVAFTNLLNFHRSDLMYSLYQYNLAKWKELQTEFGVNAVGNFSQFSATGRSSRFGYWGALESVYQPLATSPKYRALNEFAASP